MPKPADTGVEDAQLTANGNGTMSRFSLAWDTNTAVAALVLGAVVYLWLLNRGFTVY